MSTPPNIEYVVWLQHSMADPGERRTGPEAGTGYPVVKLTAECPAFAARRYVLEHGLKGGLHRQPRSRRVFGVAVVPAQSAHRVSTFTITLEFTCAVAVSEDKGERP